MGQVEGLAREAEGKAFTGREHVCPVVCGKQVGFGGHVVQLEVGVLGSGGV